MTRTRMKVRWGRVRGHWLPVGVIGGSYALGLRVQGSSSQQSTSKAAAATEEEAGKDGGRGARLMRMKVGHWSLEDIGGLFGFI